MTEERQLASYYDRDLRRDVALIERSNLGRSWYLISDGASVLGFSSQEQAWRAYNARKAQHQGE